MGKIENFSINLNKQIPMYFAGESLSGTLELKVSTKIKINSIKMTINGTAQVCWQESRTFTTYTGNKGNQRPTQSKTQTVTYRGSENYLECNLVFLTKQQNSDLYLEPGAHTYPFKIVLPQNLATSFEHPIGKVRYSLVASLEMPGALDALSIRAFSIVSPFDLNTNPSLRQPLGSTGEKQFTCGPCKSYPVVINFTIHKNGFVPGEVLIFTAEIDNKSNKRINEVIINLTQKITFRTTQKSKSVSRKVASVQYPKEIGKFSTEKWDGGLRIPPICSSSNGTCRVIDVSYDVSLVFGSYGLTFNQNLLMPIVIGTIPLKEEQSTKNESVPLTYQSSSFESESNFGLELKGDIIKSDLASYKPYYPYYDFGSKV